MTLAWIIRSMPAMPIAESRPPIVVGIRQTSNATSTGNAARPTRASFRRALSLGLQQALPGIQRVGESIGLDELTIATTELDAGSLMAGKYLSPKVYMSYTYGLFNRLGGFLLRYDINDRFSLETRSGDEKSMDLLYSTEKD